MMKKFNAALIAVAALSVGTYSTNVIAQEPAIACPGYKAPKTKLIGDRVGKKLTGAFEAYNQDQLDEAINILAEINPKDSFDRASVDRFLGQLLLQADDREVEALEKLTRSANANELNDKEQAEMLGLVADLSMQLEKYEDALTWYDKYMDFTCKEDAKTYVKIAKALTELKRYEEVIEPANKAIELQEEKNKNPYVLKLNSYTERKMYSDAVGVAETLVTIFPEEKLWWSQLGFFYMMVEDYPKALATFSVAYKQGYLTKASELKALYQLYASLEAPIKSARLHDKFLKEGIFEETAQEFATLANTYHQASEFKKAASYYGKAADMESNPDYYIKQGNLLMSAEEYRNAIVALEKALEAGADDEADVYFSLMQANYYAGDYKAAYSSAVEARKDPGMRRNANAWIEVIKNKAKNRGVTI